MLYLSVLFFLSDIVPVPDCEEEDLPYRAPYPGDELIPLSFSLTGYDSKCLIEL